MKEEIRRWCDLIEVQVFNLPLICLENLSKKIIFICLVLED